MHSCNVCSRALRAVLHGFGVTAAALVWSRAEEWGPTEELWGGGKPWPTVAVETDGGTSVGLADGAAELTGTAIGMPGDPTNSDTPSVARPIGPGAGSGDASSPRIRRGAESSHVSPAGRAVGAYPKHDVGRPTGPRPGTGDRARAALEIQFQISQKRRFLFHRMYNVATRDEHTV